MQASHLSVVCIGHACHDKIMQGFVPGGTVTYASLLAKNLRAEVSVITSTGPDFLFEPMFRDAGIQWNNLPADHTTCFVNTPTPEGRKQKVLSVAASIDASLVLSTHNFDIVHLGPIANEINPNVIPIFQNALIGLSIQGWLRRWDAEGNVYTQNMNWQELKGIDLVFASEEDIAHDPDSIREIIQQVPALILTNGKEGATIYTKTIKTHVPAYPVKEQDATGAGDTFAISFLLHFKTSNDYLEACRFAHCTASLVVEGNRLPQPQDIALRLNQYKSLFHI